MVQLLGLVLHLAISRSYHVETFASIATSRHTHVQVTGRVTLIRREGDGDVHLRLVDPLRSSSFFVVAEIIPRLTVPVPARVGDCVRVRGIRRVDNEAGHGWPEVHPVEQLAVVPCPVSGEVRR